MAASPDSTEGRLWNTLSSTCLNIFVEPRRWWGDLGRTSPAPWDIVRRAAAKLLLLGRLGRLGRWRAIARM